LLKTVAPAYCSRTAAPRQFWEEFRLKVLVVDDHPLIRQALRVVLTQLDSNLQVLEAGNCQDALALAEAHGDLDIVLLDIHLPGVSGLDALQSFRQRAPAVPVVVVSASEDPDDVTRALDSGAMGYIPKSQSSQVMINALRLVLAGGVYLPPEMVRRSHATAGSPQPVPSPANTSYRDIGLTERQAQVLALLIQGKPNKLICRDLDLAEGTVKIHITAILKALKVSNRTQAVIEVSRLGLKLPTRLLS
jgi:DNA-binding NarL/FixJ family response regulator